MKADVFLGRAKQNLETAKLVLATGDTNSACSRAYYAMHDAARAALCAIGQEEAAFSKTHSGLSSQFSLHVIRPGLLAKDLSTKMSSALKQRIIADYDGLYLSADVVSSIVADAEMFLSAIVDLIERYR